MESADLQMALQTVPFAAAGTTGQRCTSLRRLLVHEPVYDTFITKLKHAYTNLRVNDPLVQDTHVGPLHNQQSVELFQETVQQAVAQGGTVLIGGNVRDDTQFVDPTIIEIDPDAPIVQEERFVPILYVSKIQSLDEGIRINNQVNQGLSSALFTTDMREAFQWTDQSDTGIVNINTSCSGAEIGAAFGGNKHTGWGRESGSDAWKQYMRRSTIYVYIYNSCYKNIYSYCYTCLFSDGRACGKGSDIGICR